MQKYREMGIRMKTLVIVESPAKAEKIQGYLGDDYIVLASRGHITELSKNRYRYQAGSIHLRDSSIDWP